MRGIPVIIRFPRILTVKDGIIAYNFHKWNNKFSKFYFFQLLRNDIFGYFDD